MCGEPGGTHEFIGIFCISLAVPKEEQRCSVVRILDKVGSLETRHARDEWDRFLEPWSDLVDGDAQVIVVGYCVHELAPLHDFSGRTIHYSYQLTFTA
jgi:hypothetical protein